MGGVSFKHGLGAHADSEIFYNLRGIYNRFIAHVGVDDDAGASRGSVEFSVLADGRLLWQSGVMKQGDAPKSVDVSIQGTGTLLLRVTDAGDGIDYDHADWGDAQVLRSGNTH